MFDRFLVRFGCHFWPIWEAEIDSNRPKFGPRLLLKRVVLKKMSCSRKHLKTHEKSTKLTPRGDRKWTKIAPRWPQDGLISVLFSFRFLYRFFVVCWFNFGAILGDFWEPKSIIFGIYFCMIFACRFKIAPRAAKSGPRAAKSGLRAA